MAEETAGLTKLSKLDENHWNYQSMMTIDGYPSGEISGSIEAETEEEAKAKLKEIYPNVIFE
jgi:hypothetical protein